MFGIMGWMLFGLAVGAIAKFLMPGRDPGPQTARMTHGRAD